LHLTESFARSGFLENCRQVEAIEPSQYSEGDCSADSLIREDAVQVIYTSDNSPVK